MTARSQANQSFVGVCLAGFLTFLAAAPAAATPLTDALDYYVANKPQQGPMHGSVLVAQGTNILFQKAYGMSDKADNYRRATINDQYMVASMSKFITAVAVMKAVQDGYIGSTNDLVSQYLPNVPPAHAALRISDLLKHTGGIGGTHWGLWYTCGLSDNTQWQWDWDTLYPDWSYRTMASNLLSKAPHPAYLGVHCYADSSPFLAAYVVARAVAGTYPPGQHPDDINPGNTYQYYYNYVQSAILNPLGMTSTAYEYPVTNYQAPDFAHPHEWGPTYLESDMYYGAFMPSTTYWKIIGPFGGFRMTTTDYWKLLRGVFTNTAFLSAANAALMINDTVIKSHQPFQYLLYSAGANNYGYGIQKTTLDGRTAYFHQGRWTPQSTNSVFLYFPVEDVAVLVFKNVGADWSGLFDTDEIAAKLQEIYFAHAAGYVDNLSFVTSASYTGNLGGLTGADQLCTTAAHGAGLRTNARWRAILSSGNPAAESIPFDAVRRINLYGPVKNTVGQTIANFTTTLWSPILLALNKYNQNGADVGAAPVWTASNAQGKLLSSYRDCDDWTSAGTSTADIGYPGYLDFNRMDYYWSDRYCNGQARLYCISQTVTGP